MPDAVWPVTGHQGNLRPGPQQCAAIAAKHGGAHVGTLWADKWKHNRFRSVYLRNTLWQPSFVADTVETACDWPRSKHDDGDGTGRHRCLAANSASRCTPTRICRTSMQGSSVYTTFVWPMADDFQTNLQRWQAMKHAVRGDCHPRRHHQPSARCGQGSCPHLPQKSNRSACRLATLFPPVRPGWRDELRQPDRSKHHGSRSCFKASRQRHFAAATNI